VSEDESPTIAVFPCPCGAANCRSVGVAILNPEMDKKLGAFCRVPPENVEAMIAQMKAIVAGRV
jgi:hypothetical protein